jgi:hypothetical protein
MARIDRYEFGRIVVNGNEHTSDLIILPDCVVGNWWRRDGHALVTEDLRDVLDDLPAHLGRARTGSCAPILGRSSNSASKA